MSKKKSALYFPLIYIAIFLVCYSPQLLRYTDFFAQSSSYVLFEVNFSYIAIIGIVIIAFIAILFVYKIIIIDTVAKTRLVVMEFIFILLILILYLIAAENMIIRVSFLPSLVPVLLSTALGVLASFVITCFKISCYVRSSDTIIEYIPSDD